MSTARWFPFAAMGSLIVLAGLLAAGWPVWWLMPIHWLGRYPLFHVAAHFGIFAGLGLLYQPQRHGVKSWLFVFTGGVVLEMAQVLAGRLPLTTQVLSDSLFDVMVDAAGFGAVFAYPLLGKRT